jgi:hypothetical protein
MLDKVKKTKNPREKAEIIWEFYCTRKLTIDLEPSWTHPSYLLVEKYLNNTIKKNELPQLVEVIKSHEQQDGKEVLQFVNRPSGPVRIMHEGWKIGSPTWVFMGRNLHPKATQYLGNGWIAVCREVPSELYKLFDPSIPNLVWIAYHRDRPMTFTESENCIGPAVFYDVFIKLTAKIAGKLPENPDPKVN